MSDQTTAPAGFHDLEQQSLEHLNGEIRRCLLSYASAAGPRRSEYLRQLIWAETMREKLHDVPAPKRRRA